MATVRRSRVFSISMPPEMAERAEAVAKAQNRTISELMREAFRVYEERRVTAHFENVAAGKPDGYTQEGVSGRVVVSHSQERTS